MKEGMKVGMNNNSSEILLRKAALKTAYENNLINLSRFNQELEKINNIEKRLTYLEKHKNELIKEAKKKLKREFALI